MEKYNLEEGKESLDRIKLLMSYKNTMTLTENLEVVNEQQRGNSLATNVKNILAACTTESTESMGASSRIFNDDEIDQIAKGFFDAMEGMGTDWDKIKELLTKLSNGTFADLCAVNNHFFETYGGGDNLYQWLDSDIDYDEEWSEVLQILNKIRKKHTETTKKIDASNATLETFKEYIRTDWGGDYSGKETFRMGDYGYYIVNDGTNDYFYMMNPDKTTFKFIQ